VWVLGRVHHVKAPFFVIEYALRSVSSAMVADTLALLLYFKEHVADLVDYFGVATGLATREALS
jgi:hypothetical protein